MLSKLLKKDLKKNMSWMWILFVSTIGLAGLTRGCRELGTSVAFFKIITVALEGIFYGLAINSIIQPFLRNFLNFHKSFYSDESYLTHTLPVTKNQLINSKFLTALIEMLAGFATIIVSILIMYARPGFTDVLKLFISTAVTGSVSIIFTLILFVILVLVEFLMFLSIINFSIVVAYKSKENRKLKTFLIAAACALLALAILAICMLIVLLINGIKITSSNLILSSSAMYSVFITAILLYSAATILFYFLTKHQFNKGLDVD